MPAPEPIEYDLSRQAVEPAITRIEALLHEAHDRNENLRLLALQEELPHVIAAARLGLDAEDSGWHNFNLMTYLTDYFIARNALSTKRTEEVDGPMASAMNIIDSFEALIEAAKNAKTAD